MNDSLQYKDFMIRPWQPGDREAAGALIAAVLAEYGLGWDATGSDRDAWEVEACYWETGGEFWVVYQGDRLVGTGGYHPIDREPQAVEIRKMYLHQDVRGQGLGRFLLACLEQAAGERGFDTICLETASVLKEAVGLYESAGYQPVMDVATPRCDRAYVKRLKSVPSSV
jgi:putative acetyltransferase